MAVHLSPGPARAQAAWQVSRGRAGAVALRSEPLGTAYLRHGQLRCSLAVVALWVPSGTARGLKGLSQEGTHRRPLCAGPDRALCTCRCL